MQKSGWMEHITVKHSKIGSNCDQYKALNETEISFHGKTTKYEAKYSQNRDICPTNMRTAT